MSREGIPGEAFRFDDRPHEECGVVAIYDGSKNENSLTTVAQDVVLALDGVQHRGQESAGIAATLEGKDNKLIVPFGDLGLVEQVFRDGSSVRGLNGQFGLGHVRYATSYMTGRDPSKEERRLAIQPMVRQPRPGVQFALGYNGNIENITDLMDKLRSEKGKLDQADQITDTAVMTSLISERVAHGQTIPAALLAVANEMQGAYSMTVWGKEGNDEKIYALRDPYGFRPLVLGALPKGWMVASEVGALNIAEAEFVREIEPGELVEIGPDGVFSSPGFPHLDVDPRICLFEYFYLSRPDNQIAGQRVERVRVRSGIELAKEHPVEGADAVIQVPESGKWAAKGYARQLGLLNEDGFVRNRYSPSRSFIEATQADREKKIRLKISGIIPENVEGKSLVVVDDSLIRSNTMRILTAMLRRGSARQIHVRIAAPPIRHRCHYGVDMPNEDELIAAHMSTEEIRQVIGADSLEYLSIEGLRKASGVVDQNGRALGATACRLCDACMTGDYPTRN